MAPRRAAERYVWVWMCSNFCETHSPHVLLPLQSFSKEDISKPLEFRHEGSGAKDLIEFYQASKDQGAPEISFC